MKRGGKRTGSGRPKGSPNKINGLLKEAILEALENSGGIDYLSQQAEEHPTAFLTLLGKTLPMTIAGDKDNPLNISSISVPKRESREEWLKNNQ